MQTKPRRHKCNQGERERDGPRPAWGAACTDSSGGEEKSMVLSAPRNKFGKLKTWMLELGREREKKNSQHRFISIFEEKKKLVWAFESISGL